MSIFDKIKGLSYGKSREVILVSCNSRRKIQTIKAVREITRYELKEAVDIVENTPQSLKKDATPNEIKIIRAMLKPLGAVIEVK